MKNFTEFFLRRPLVVHILLIAIFLLAYMSVRETNRNAYPEVDLATMIITTEYPGASPKDVEQNVTRLIEEELEGIPGIDKFTSVSSESVSVVTVEVDIDYPDQEEVKVAVCLCYSRGCHCRTRWFGHRLFLYSAHTPHPF